MVMMESLTSNHRHSPWRVWLAASVSGCMLFVGPTGAATAAPSDGVLLGQWSSHAPASVEALKVAVPPQEGGLSTLALQTQSGYLVWDLHPDPLGDPVNDATPGQPAVMTPELVESLMAVTDDDPATSADERSLLLFMASTTPDQPTNAADLAVVALDTNGDLLDDYVTYSPDPPFALEPMPYETPVLRVSGSQETDTGESAVWLRHSDAYSVALDAWALGLTSVRFAIELEDNSSNYDWAPDDYVGAPVALPQPPPPPVALPSPPESVVSWPSHGAIQVLFQGSASAGSSPITHYTATADPGGATCTTSQPPYPLTSPNSYECWILGLTNGQAYLVSVTAHSASGVSTPTFAVNGAVTPLAPPSPPPSPPVAPSPPCSLSVGPRTVPSRCSSRARRRPGVPPSPTTRRRRIRVERRVPPRSRSIQRHALRRMSAGSEGSPMDRPTWSR